MRLSDRLKFFKKSKIVESLKVLEQDPSIISLGAGEPDFPAPPNVIAAAQKALKKGFTHYSPTQGKLELREAIAEKLRKENKIDASADEIIVTCGSKEALLIAMLTLINPGDEVIVQDPGYNFAYMPMVRMLDGIVHSLQLREEDSFSVHPGMLRKLITEKTKLFILNSPSNPTGGVVSKKDLEEIADVVVEKGITVLSDEAYEKLVYDDVKHVSLASLNGMKEYVITTQSFSKSFAMCGFRIGYAVAKREIIEKMNRFKLTTTICAPTAFQIAAVEALKHAGDHTEKMRREYDRRRKMIVRRLNELPGIRCSKPKGAFYAFPNITGLGMSSEEVADFLLEKAKVLTIPGTEFGRYGEGYLRLSYATSYEKIEEAMNRIESAIDKL